MTNVQPQHTKARYRGHRRNKFAAHSAELLDELMDDEESLLAEEAALNEEFEARARSKRIEQQKAYRTKMTMAYAVFGFFLIIGTTPMLLQKSFGQNWVWIMITFALTAAAIGAHIGWKQGPVDNKE